MTKMVAKGFRFSRLSAAVAATLAIAAAVTPDHSAFGSTMSATAGRATDAIVGTGRGKKSNAIVGTGVNAIVGTGDRKSVV